MGVKVKYKKRFKFVTSGIITEYVGIFPPKSIYFEWGTLSENGFLTIKDEYPWNGMSGIPLNISSSIRGVLFHDIIYRMIRLGLIDMKWKKKADQNLHDFCVEDGMLRPVASIILKAVKKFGLSSTMPKAEPEVLEAP